MPSRHSPGSVGPLCAVVLAFTAFLPTPSHAQSGQLERIQPQTVPDVARPAAPDTKPEGGGKEKDAIQDTPLGIDLKGIAFFSDPADVTRQGLGVDEHSDRTNGALIISALPVPELQSPQFAARLQPYAGIALTTGVLDKLKKEISRYYQLLGRPFVSVTIPPQDISSGLLQILVVEARAGAVTVKGNTYFGTDQYLSTLRVKKGDRIDINQLNADVDWINRNPFRNADVVTRAGDKFGETDIAVVTNERYPLRVYGGLDNFGSENSGKNRMLAGFNWGDAFKLGHELNYQHTRSFDFGRSQAHSGSYVVPLEWRHVFSLSASYAKSHPDIGSLFDSEGTSWSVEPAYVIPLQKRGDYSHEFSMRTPFKVSDNTLDFSSTPITDNTTHVVQLELGYAGNWRHEEQQYGGNVTAVGSPGGLSARNEDTHFDSSRSGASARYGILRGGASFSTALPKGFHWSTNANGQLATGNLLGGEQLSLAGVGAVRGYDNGLAYRDNGLVVRNELSAPEFSLMDLVANDPAFNEQFELPPDTMTIFAFFDAAVGRNVEPVQGEQARVKLASTGVGIRYALGSLLSLDMSYGWQLTDNPPSLDARSSQLHISMTIGY